MAKIFISYRREDAGFAVDQVHAALKPYAASADDIFVDVDNIPPGVDFVEHLNKYVDQCDVMLVAIGVNWLRAVDASGNRRLDDPEDFVRIEIESALARGIPVVPLLLGGAKMPGVEQLPETLRPLVRRQAVEIPRGGVQPAIDRMMHGLGFAEVRKTGSVVPGWLVPLAAVLVLAAGGFGLWQSGVLDQYFEGADASIEVAEIKPESAPSVTTGAANPAAQSPRYRPGDTFRDRLSGGGEGPQMVVVPGGTFRMASNDGASDEKPVHSVTIPRNFAVGKFEVTWSEWGACVADGGCNSSGPEGAGGDNGWGKGNRPVIEVDWNDAKAYVRWLSRKTGEDYRLLSEAEWEYAARAGSTGKYSWGNNDPSCSKGATNSANYSACSSDRTESVGFSSANAFGLHDLHGNVWEWTEDCWNGSHSGAPSNGSAWLSGECDLRVLRGGSWDNDPVRLRSADRGRLSATFRLNNIGFRIARDLSE